ncbi:MAG: BrnT family toxin [Nitrospira sp.]|nr:BrnT family toxin [Nitrospira sp.]
MFTWDVAKALSKYEKHGVSFEEAATVFGDASALDWQDLAHSQQEPRFKRLGGSLNGRIILIVYTRRKVHETHTIRIISARQANRKERQAHARLAD